MAVLHPINLLNASSKPFIANFYAIFILYISFNAKAIQSIALLSTQNLEIMIIVTVFL